MLRFCIYLIELCFFWSFLNALRVTLHLPRIRRGQEECEGSFISRGRLPASQQTSKRLSFDSLLVFLSDRITLSHNIHERCWPLTYLKSADSILFFFQKPSATPFSVRASPCITGSVFPESWDRAVNIDLFHRIGTSLPEMEFSHRFRALTCF